jgi:oxygen-independent coproporphyrinogen-3 oxidase
MLQFLEMETLGVYIQVPFCQTKCTYCNFHTGVVSPGRFAPYAAAVHREIDERRELWKSAGINYDDSRLTVDTVYFGGGTPSLLEPELLENMLNAVRGNFDDQCKEITLEADPETVTTQKAKAWSAAGINRVSFGVQSFVDEELRAAGRMHRSADVYRAIPLLREAGIQNISFDLIAGLPKQTRQSWQYSLSELIALSPEHVSIYMMEIDESSRLGLEVLQGGARYNARELPSEESMAEFYEFAQAELSTAGYQQYEISNWAKPGLQSRHNLKYWRREPYLGFGAAAHSFSGAQRWANLHDAAEYVAAISQARSPQHSVETVTQQAALEEEFFLGLRQLAGINVGRIETRYGVDFHEKVARLSLAGMLQRRGELVRLNPEKLSMSNEVIVELLR